MAYAPRALVNLLEDAIRFHGQMHNAMAAQKKAPLLMLIYLGNMAVISVPQDKEFAEMFVPSCANANTNEMRNTPALVPRVNVVSRNFCRTSRGDQ